MPWEKFLKPIKLLRSQMLNEKAFKSRIELINRRLSLMKRVKNGSLKFLLGNINLYAGKRIRGLLVLLTAEAAAGRSSRGALDAACAMEILHHATLIHDDIIDNAKKRRGGPALNRRLGYEFSVLAGDYLFSKASKIITGSGRDIFNVFVDAVGKVCEGEIDEVYNKNNPSVSAAKYTDIIRKKTAALIKASVMTGALSAGVNAGRLKSLAEFGEKTGLAFQIRDDILDMTSNEKALGKPAGNDIREGKATLPFILALKNAEPAGRRRAKKLFREKKSGPLLKFIRDNNGIEAAQKEAEKLSGSAKKALNRAGLRHREKREMLERMADYAVTRKR